MRNPQESSWVVDLEPQRQQEVARVGIRLPSMEDVQSWLWPPGTGSAMTCQVGGERARDHCILLLVNHLGGKVGEALPLCHVWSHCVATSL